MRDYRPIQETLLLSSGENISPALRALSPELRRDVADWIEELCLSPFDDLEFEETQLREVMLYVTESTGRRISARSLSDGTLRFLGLVTALLTTPPGGIVVIEEPDMGMHPARVHLLAELLEQVTEAGRIQVVATTHSPVLLAHLSDSSLANVVALSRDPTSRTTVATRAGDLPDFGMLRDRAHTEELISTGWLERAV
jgi:predicted ATPase